MTLGQRVRELRKALGMTQEELADKIGVDRSYLSQIETGKKVTPSLEMLTMLARALETSPDDLFRAVVPALARDSEDVDLNDPTLDLQLWQPFRELTPEERESVKAYIRFVRSQRKERGGSS